MDKKINRPLLRYFGGKWRLAQWIMDYFPPHVCYCEPFGGGGSVLIQKPPSAVEFYNDLNSDVVTLFRVLRNRPDDLIRAIDLTPYAYTEYKKSFDSCLDEVECARRTYIRYWMNMGGRDNKTSGWRITTNDDRGNSPVDDWQNIEHLYAIAARLKKVNIDNRDAIELIQRCDSETTLFYVDPPYVHESRGSARYVFDYSDEQHVKLASVLNNVKGMVILSGYANTIYDNLYSNWHVVKKNAVSFRSKKTVEFLWINAQCLTAKKNFLF